MGGMKIKGRGKDKKKRKSRKTTQKSNESEEVKPNLLRGIIDTISEKVRKEKEEPWSLDIGPPVRVPMLGRHVFKRENIVEIDLGKL